MRVAIFGASGLLGKALMREWSGDAIAGFSSRDVDIRDASAVEAIAEETEPEWIVLAAAYTDVDGCENNPDLAFTVNRDGDARHPQSVYGRSKAEAEIKLLELMPESCIVRTSWLFGLGGKCFADTILKLAASRPTLDVVNDQRGCPTYTVDLARAIIRLCCESASGIVHVTNAGECTWFEFASAIVQQVGLATTVRPVSSQQMARPAPRPVYSVLSPESLRRLRIEMPTWGDALQRYLRQRNG